MAVIERLREAHVPAIVLLGHAFFLEARRYSKFVEYDVPTALEFAREHLEWPYVGWVALEEGVPIGMLLAHMTRVCFGQARMAVEDALYVTPEYRGGFAAPLLIRTYERWAEESGARFADLNITSGIRQERTQRLCERLGFEECGSIMRRVF